MRGARAFPIALLFGVMMLGGCTARPALVRMIVRDQHAAPVSGALIDARPLQLFLPVYPFDTFDPADPRASSAITDERGAALLDLAPDRPTEVIITTESLDVWRGTVQPRVGPGDRIIGWSVSPAPHPDSPALDVEIEPAGNDQAAPRTQTTTHTP